MGQYLTLGEVPIEEVLSYVVEDKRDEGSRREYVIDGVAYQIKMHSDRLRVFKRNRKCVVCGIEGTRILAQRDYHSIFSTAHFNLYAEDSVLGLILMTKDHIIPKKKGGQDLQNNFQTMCCICNGIKGSENFSNETILELRNKKLESQLREILEASTDES